MKWLRYSECVTWQEAQELARNLARSTDVEHRIIRTNNKPTKMGYTREFAVEGLDTPSYREAVYWYDYYRYSAQHGTEYADWVMSMLEEPDFYEERESSEDSFGDRFPMDEYELHHGKEDGWPYDCELDRGMGGINPDDRRYSD